MLTCKEFEHAWNDQLDRPTVADVRPTALEAHAAVCADCRAIHARYVVLAQAIRERAPVAGPSPGFTEGVLSAWRLESRRPRVFRLPARLAALATAAALVVGVTLGLRTFPPGGPGESRAVRSVERVPGGFTRTLADVTSATLDLARETSAPAARVGRDVLASAELSTASTDATTSLTLPLALPLGVPSSEVWQRIGDRLSAGVRPLEGSARSAFGFLRVAPDDPKSLGRPSPGA